MRYLAAICAVVIGMVPGLSSANDLFGVLNQVAQSLAAVNGNRQANPAAYPGNTAPPVGALMASMDQADGEQQIQLLVPKDQRTREAMDAALPTVKKVLAIHQCVKNWESLRLLNIYAVPGVDMARATDQRFSFPNAKNNGMGVNLQYHDQNKCVAIRTIDQWTMPALNALNFRVVYFANDSGETVNFNYFFKKVDDGSWKIARTCTSYGC